MTLRKLISKKIDNFFLDLGKDYLAFFYNPILSKYHLNEIIHLLHYRHFKEFKILTSQERKCLYLAGKGKTIKDTSIILNVGFHTAREYREDSIKKINATNITEAAVKYYEQIKN
jgi:DNA-binding CsgD family transcriptional regulator